MKTRAIRSGLAEQAEQHLELNDLRKATLQEAARTGEDFTVVDSRIRDAMQMEPMDKGASMAALSPEERAIAKGYQAFDQAQVAKDLAQNLKPGVRHSHIEKARKDALSKIAAAQSGKLQDVRAAKRAVKRFETLTKETGIAAPRTLGRKIDLAGAKDVLNRTPEMLTGHAPAVATPEAQVIIGEMGGKAGTRGAGGPSLGRMGASKVAQIQGNRSLTSAEKEANFQALVGQVRPGTPPPPLYKSLLESTMIRGDQRAARRASVSFMRDFGAKFGQKVSGDIVPEGTVRLSELNFPKSGLTSAEAKAMESTVVPRREFNAAQAALGSVKTAPSQAADIFAKSARWWKQAVLLRTGYTIRNVLDNTTSAAQFGARGEYAVPALKASLLAHGITELPSGLKIDPNEIIPGLGMTLEQYVASARRTGELSGGFMQSEIPTVTGKKGLTKAVGTGLEHWRNLNAVLENSGRAVLGMSKRADGMPLDEVGALVDDALGKYHPAFLSPGERTITTYVFPWYNWMKQIAKRSARLAIDRPGSVAAVASFQAESNREQGFTPQNLAKLGPSVKESGAFLRRTGVPGKVEVFPTSVYGPTDINRMLGLGERGSAAILENPALQTYPPVQWLAALAGFNIFKNKPFTGEKVELPATASVLLGLPDNIRRSLGIVDWGDGKVAGPDRLDYILRQSGPQATALGDIASRDPESQRKALAFWTGLSSYIADQAQSGKIERGIERGTKKEERSIKFRSKMNERKSRLRTANEEAVRQMVSP